MEIAKGGMSWILSEFSIFIIFSLGYLLTDNFLQSVFLLLSVLSGLLTLFFLIFFRDPIRTIGKGIVAVADGSIREIDSIQDDDIGPAWFISTFMNIYHVHVNRMPIEGTIKNMTHIPGSHLPAYKKESDRNERVIILVETKKGLVKIVLIAGTIARRIVPYIKKGETLKKGEKISLIRLGSRVDVYLPKKMNITVNVNVKDRVKAGGSTIATSDV